MSDSPFAPSDSTFVQHPDLPPGMRIRRDQADQAMPLFWAPRRPPQPLVQVKDDAVRVTDGNPGR